MSGSGPKTKNPSHPGQKEVTAEQDLAPLTPLSEATLQSDNEVSSHNRIEPIFSKDTSTPAPSVSLSIPTPDPMVPELPRLDALPIPEGLDTEEPPPLPEASRSLDAELSRMKPDIDNIARIPREALSEDQSQILKRYVSLKEVEVRDLRDQQRQYQAFIKKISTQLEQLTRKNRALLTELETANKSDAANRDELKAIRQKSQEEVLLLKQEMEQEAKAQPFPLGPKRRVSTAKKREWKGKIQEDLKRIKLKERELENKTELLKRDMQALLDSKDKHLLDLKKKNDALEMEMESLEDRIRKTNIAVGNIDSKKRRLIETFKLAIALLESIDSPEPQNETSDKNRKAG